MTTKKRDELILSLSGSVSYQARRMHATLPQGLITRRDLESAAWLGAIQAVDRWDKATGVSLATFAEYRIVGEMNDYLRSLDPISRRLRTEYKAAVEAARLADSPHPSAPYFEVPIEKVANISDHLSYKRFRALEARLDLETIIARSKMTARELAVIRRYALDGERMKAIGQSCGLVESRVSQIRTAAMAKLRKAA